MPNKNDNKWITNGFLVFLSLYVQIKKLILIDPVQRTEKLLSSEIVINFLIGIRFGKIGDNLFSCKKQVN
jgi:hypothetical protein